MKKINAISLVITAILGTIVIYFTNPPLNITSLEFWGMIGLLLTIFAGISFMLSMESYYSENKVAAGAIVLVGIIIVGVVAVGFFTTPLFNSNKRANIVSMETKDFKTEFTLSDVEKIPMLDRDTATNLGNRKLGELDELVSQYVPSREYTQINIKGEPYRATPLKYAGFFKWLSNKDEGIGHYLKVNMYNGKTELVELEENMKYSYSERFGRNVERHLWKNYPTKIFGTPSFEIDDEGNPFYIATVYKKLFGLSGKDATGLLIVNPVDGKIEEYELDNIPNWVDRVYGADLVEKHLNWHLRFQGGYWNSLTSKKGVRVATKGYNYIPMNDDIYYYTGVTSDSSDSSNLGFALVNMRTKEYEYYPLSSAEEYSAMESAQGTVQEQGYTATFPLLLNLDGNPWYIVSLKDDNGLIRAYSLIDVQDYQVVHTKATIKELLKSLADGGDYEYVEDGDKDSDGNTLEEVLTNVKGEVTKLKDVVKNGNTHYYFVIDGKIYQANINLNAELPYLENGNVIEFEVNEAGKITKIKEIE